MKKFMWLASAVLAVSCVMICGNARAEWLWTPESGKWISEKNIEKKSAMVLYEQAQGFEQAKDIPKAISTYRKLIKQYPSSTIAPDAQYTIGRLLEEQGDYYKAFKEYHKVLEDFPSYKKFNEILEREYQIGNLFLSGEKMKFLGFGFLPAVDKSIEIFEAIVHAAPYGQIAPRAQFNIGEAYRKIKRYAEAIPEYQKVVENYPDSDLSLEAQYQIGECSYQKTLKDSYDQTNTDVALDAMKSFVGKHQDSKKAAEMKARMEELVQRKAKKDFDIAEFYRKSNSDESAIIYYQGVIEEYPQTEYAQLAEKKIAEIAIKPPKKIELAGGKPGKLAFLTNLWPFGKKPETSVAPAAAPAAKEAAPTVVSAAAEKKPGWFAGVWPFGKKVTPVKEAEVKKAVVKEAPKAKGGKPWWAFWVAGPKAGTPIVLKEELLNPAAAVAPAVVPQAPVARKESAPAIAPDKKEEKAVTSSGTAPAAPPVVTAPQEKPLAPGVLQIKSLRWEQSGSKLRLLFQTTGNLDFKTFYLKDPARVLISFPKNVVSLLQETTPVNKMGVRAVRQHFRAKGDAMAAGTPLNAIVIDMEKSQEVNVRNDANTFVIEIEKS